MEHYQFRRASVGAGRAGQVFLIFQPVLPVEIQDDAFLDSGIEGDDNLAR